MSGEPDGTGREDPRPASAPAGRPPGGPAAPDVETVTVYLHWGALAVLVCLALVATVGFYTSATATIGRWVTPAYQPLFRAGFNLVLLLAAGVGISAVLRGLN